MTDPAATGGTADSRRLLTDAEREAIGAATAYANANGSRSRAGERYLDALEDARRDICRRFVRGILRGDPDGVPAPVFASRPSLRPEDANALLSEFEFGPDDLRERLEPVPASCESVAFVPLPESQVVVAAPVDATYGYDRFRFAGSVQVLDSTGSHSPHPVDLVAPLEREGAFPDGEQAARIADELAESVANLALARLARELDSDPETPADGTTVFEAIADRSDASPTAALERLVVDGHPFHPGAKIRRGMSPSASLAYAPELTDRIDVRFAAVDRTTAMETEATAAASLTDLLFDRFDGLEAAVERAVPADRGLESYAVVPIHPWQYHHRIPDRYADEIERGRVVRVPEFSWPATPLLNLRTVVPYPSAAEPTARESTAPQSDRSGRDEPLPHLKLAVDVQLTNVVRTVSPQAVYNGPRVTDLLAEIRDRESLESLAFARELAATCYHAPGGPHPEGEPYHDARNLSGLARLNPVAHPDVPSGGVPIAASALLATSPATGRPIVRDLLERWTDAAGERTGVSSGGPLTDTDPDAAAFFDAYVATIVPESLLLLCKYGVALEAHAQNVQVVFADGRPVTAVVRDFGGIRALDDRLAAHGLTLETYPDSDIDADGRRDVYEKLYYALFQNHLTELLVVLVEHTPLAESTGWSIVRRHCLETFDRLRADPDVDAAWVDRAAAALFADPITHKALTAMRLRGERHEYVRSRVSNPLADGD